MEHVQLLVIDDKGFPTLSYGDGTGKTREEVEASARAKYQHINNPACRFLWDDEAAKFERDRQWEKLEPIQRWMIETAIPELNEDIKKRNAADKLLRVAQSRIIKAGFTQTCGRCGGSGNYSYNQIDGTVCYGCRGKKVSIVRMTAVNKKAIAKHFADQQKAGE